MSKPELSTDLQRYIDQHESSCLECGYSLLGLSAAECPECGSAFTIESLSVIEGLRKYYLFAILGYYISGVLMVLSLVLSPIGLVYIAVGIYWTIKPRKIKKRNDTRLKFSAKVAWAPVVLGVAYGLLLAYG